MPLRSIIFGVLASQKPIQRLMKNATRGLEVEHDEALHLPWRITSRHPGRSRIYQPPAHVKQLWYRGIGNFRCQHERLIGEEHLKKAGIVKQQHLRTVFVWEHLCLLYNHFLVIKRKLQGTRFHQVPLPLLQLSPVFGHPPRVPRIEWSLYLTSNRWLWDRKTERTRRPFF